MRIYQKYLADKLIHLINKNAKIWFVWECDEQVERKVNDLFDYFLCILCVFSCGQWLQKVNCQKATNYKKVTKSCLFFKTPKYICFYFWLACIIFTLIESNVYKRRCKIVYKQQLQTKSITFKNSDRQTNTPFQNTKMPESKLDHWKKRSSTLPFSFYSTVFHLASYSFGYLFYMSGKKIKIQTQRLCKNGLQMKTERLV